MNNELYCKQLLGHYPLQDLQTVVIHHLLLYESCIVTLLSFPLRLPTPYSTFPYISLNNSLISSALFVLEGCGLHWRCQAKKLRNDDSQITKGTFLLTFLCLKSPRKSPNLPLGIDPTEPIYAKLYHSVVYYLPLCTSNWDRTTGCYIRRGSRKTERWQYHAGQQFNLRSVVSNDRRGETIFH